MKLSILSCVGSLIGLVSHVDAAPFTETYFGPAISTGPSQVDMIRTVTTIVPGRCPPNQRGALYLWPGISNGTGDLIQSCMTSWIDNNCGQNDDEYEWCTEASVLISGDNFQTVARSSPVKPTDRIKIEYVRGAPQANGYEWEWHQYVTMEATGELLSDLTSVSGNMRGWGTATECQAGCVPTIDPHYYYNTVITLESGDFSYGDTIGAGGGATFSGFVPNEDGSEWRIDEIYIPTMNPDP